MSEKTPAAMPGLLARRDMEERETALLAPYGMHSANSQGREHDEGGLKARGIYRSAYQRDRDRIIHCTAFRRLEYKTQVFVNHEGDNFRTRLTHTLEVSQISRGIARALRLNEDLTEAVALAHDLGHTPFGHSGEDALHELMAAHGGFEHNTHGLRIIDRIEHRYPNFPGLNLSYEVRECVAKHSTRHDSPMPTEFDASSQTLLEGQAVDAADEIAYNNHDVEDGVRAGIIKPDQLGELELWREASGRADEAFRGMGHDVKPTQVITFLIHILTIQYMNSIEVPDELPVSPSPIITKILIPDIGPIEEPEPELTDGELKEEKKADGGGGQKAGPKGPDEKGLLALITRKDSTGGAVADLLSDGLGEDITDALSNLGGVKVARTGNVGTRQLGGGGGPGTVGIDGLGNINKGGTIDTGAKAIRRVSTVRTQQGTVQGKLDRALIAATVRKYLNGIKACYEMQLKRDPSLKGKVVVRFTIGMDGRVSSVTIVSSTLNDELVQNCIKRRIGRWRLA